MALGTATGIRSEVSNGNALQRMRAAAARTAAKLNAAIAQGQRSAAESRANAARSTSTGDMVSRALTANRAFWARIGTEAQKYRAAFFLLAFEERKKANASTIAAMRAAQARERETLILDAERASDRADMLEQAAEKAAEATKNVPEPPSLARTVAENAAVFVTPGQEVTRNGRFVEFVNPKLMHPLVRGFYPNDLARAAMTGRGGHVSGIAGHTLSGDWGAVLQNAMQTGAAAAGQAASNAAADLSKRDPTLEPYVGSLRSVLAAVAATLGVKDPSTSDASGASTGSGYDVPWGTIAGVAIAAGVGYLVLKAVM